jgi:type II secretory pathway component GspD/PulD (secretin)
MIRVLLILVLAAAATFARAQEVEVLQLRYRTADQVIPVLQPLVEPGGALTGMQNSLIVRASRRNIEQLRQALAAIDTQPRRLLISIRQDASGVAARSGIAVSGAVTNRGSDVGVRVQDAQMSGMDNVSQQVQGLEGSPAFISIGQSVPLNSAVVTQVPGGGTVVQRSTTIQNYATGMFVIPRVSGDRVTLEIGTQRDRPIGDGVARTQGITTTASGRLGEWIELGGVAQSASAEGRGILSGGQSMRSDTRSVWVRVDELR